MGLVEWSMVLCLSILWGMSFFLVELLIEELLPLTIVFLRVGIAALTLWTIARILGLPFPRRIGTWTAFLGMGLLNNVIPFTLIVMGQIHIASGLAAILNATTPIFTMLVAGTLLTDERLTAAKLSGAVLGLSGVAIMIGPGALQGIGENVLAQLAILGAALSYAFAFVFGRRFKKQGLHPVTTAAGQVSGSTMFLIPVVFYFQEPGALVGLSLTGWGAVAVLGVALHRRGICSVFRNFGTRRHYQRCDCYPSDPGLGNSPGLAGFGGNTSWHRYCRDGTDCSRTCGHRWASVSVAEKVSFLRY